LQEGRRCESQEEGQFHPERYLGLAMLLSNRNLLSRERNFRDWWFCIGLRK
jgi:hypothetical protein